MSDKKIEIVTDFNPNKLLFVCLKEDKSKDKRKEDNCFFAVFNEIGDYVELVFAKDNRSIKADAIEKIVSPLYSTSKTKLKTSLGLTNENFMSIDKAKKTKYIDANDLNIEIYDKCHCLKESDIIVSDRICEPEKCYLPRKIYLVKGMQYYKKESKDKQVE